MLRRLCLYTLTGFQLFRFEVIGEPRFDNFVRKAFETELGFQLFRLEVIGEHIQP